MFTNVYFITLWYVFGHFTTSCAIFIHRCIFYHPEGLCLYSGANNQLKVYGWEPSRCYDSLVLDWGMVSDIAMAQNQLVSHILSNNDAIKRCRSKSTYVQHQVITGTNVNTLSIRPLERNFWVKFQLHHCPSSRCDMFFKDMHHNNLMITYLLSFIISRSELHSHRPMCPPMW